MKNVFTRRRGFTLVELLVVISIIAILVAILLPAVGAVRRRAQQMQCLNRVRQLGTAVLLHENSHTTLPPGAVNCTLTGTTPLYDTSGDAVCVGPNWISQILYYVEEVKKHEELTRSLDTTWNTPGQAPGATRTGAADLGVGEESPAVFICPSDRRGRPFTGVHGFTAAAAFAGLSPAAPGGDPKLAKGNFAACFGSGTFVNSDYTKNGAFEVVNTSPGFSSRSGTDGHGKFKAASNKGIRMADLQRDGASRTMLVCEILNAETPLDGRGAWIWGGMGGAAFTALFVPNAGTDDFTGCANSFTAGTIPADDLLNCVSSDTDEKTDFVSARSNHSAGVNAVFADGHAQLISQGILLNVWQALATRQGNEDVPEDF